MFQSARARERATNGGAQQNAVGRGFNPRALASARHRHSNLAQVRADVSIRARSRARDARCENAICTATVFQSARARERATVRAHEADHGRQLFQSARARERATYNVATQRSALGVSIRARSRARDHGANHTGDERRTGFNPRALASARHVERIAAALGVVAFQSARARERATCQPC